MSGTSDFRLDPDKAAQEPEHPEFVREDDGDDLPGLGEETPEFVREDDGDDLPGLGRHPDFELDPGKIANAPDALRAVPMRPSAGVSAEAAGGTPPRAPWWRVPLIVIGVIGVVVAVIAVASGGGDSTDQKAKATTDLSAPRAADAAPASGRANDPPAISALDATFDEAAYTTTYAVTAKDPAGGGLRFVWLWEPAEECGAFTTRGSTAAWAHPHRSQVDEPGVQALGLDEADLCEDTAQGAGGHPATITVRISNGVWECVAAFPGGSNEDHATDPVGIGCKRV